MWLLRYPLSLVYLLTNIAWFFPRGMSSVLLLFLIVIYFFLYKIKRYDALFVIFIAVILVCYALSGIVHGHKDYLIVREFYTSLNAPLAALMIIIFHRKSDINSYLKDVKVMFWCGVFLAIVSITIYLVSHQFSYDLLSRIHNLHWQKFTFRMTGLHANPNNFAFMLLPAIFTYPILKPYSRIPNLAIFGLVLIYFCLLLSGSRGALISAFLFLIFTIKVKSISLTQLFIFLPSTFYILTLLPDLPEITQLLDRMSIFSIEKLTLTQNRGVIFEENFDQLTKYAFGPFTGIGLPGYVGFDGPTDNSFLRLFMIGGAFLFSLTLTLIGALLFYVRKNRIIVMVVATTCIYSLVNDWFFVKSFGLIIAFCILTIRFSDTSEQTRI